MPAFKDPNKNIATYIKAKNNLIRKLVFPKPLINLNQKSIITPGIAHKIITKVEVAYALISQLTTKAP